MIQDLALWSDEPATVDLLSFNAIAETVVDALFDNELNPVALGVSGSWGSGKTTVLNLISEQIESQPFEGGKSVLVVKSDPWRYDPAVGPKESLIAEVLSALDREFKDNDDVGRAAEGAFKRLARKVNWSKAVKMAVSTAVTLQLPNLDDVMGLVSDDPDTLESEKGMASFREEFKEFLRLPALAHIQQVVVLVDDLDRCLPDTVVQTLEAIRLFLSVEGMSFVIAADEVRVAEAIRQKLQTPPAASEEESVASLYLHKIVQTTIPLPALSYFDTRAYLFLLLVKGVMSVEHYAEVVASCASLRASAGSLDDLQLPAGYDLSLQAATASRLTPILYEKFKGNPRRVKRFMNDLHVRQSIASKRGISLEADAIAKLMVLEKLLELDFQTILGWLAAGKLRTELEGLDRVADGGAALASPRAESGSRGSSRSREGIPVSNHQPDSGAYSATLIRWAKLPPKLDATEVSGYLNLAAAFNGHILIDDSLPQQIRDIAAGLTSSSQLDRTAIKDDELRQLTLGDVGELLAHLGRRMQDDPSIQLSTVNAIIKLSALHPSAMAQAKNALAKLPGKEVKAPTILLFNDISSAYSDVLDGWKESAPSLAARAINSVQGAGA